jgi:hypothetical protein
LLLASSNAISLADSGAPADEIAAALTSAERAALPVALSAARRELMTVKDVFVRSEQAMHQLVEKLTAASVRMQPHLDEGKREDWIMVQQDDVMDEPFLLVLEGIAAAKRVCKFPSEFLPTVLEHVEPRKARIQRRVDQYEKIIAAGEK